VPTDVSKSVSAVSFGDLDLDENAVALAVAWTPPEDSTVSIMTYEMYLATDAAGSGRAPIGSVGVGTNVYGISGASSDTDLTSRSHVVVCTKSTLAGQTMPAALALTAVAKGVSAVSFDDLDLDVNHVGGSVSWASPESSTGIETYT